MEVRTLVKVDLSKAVREQVLPLHNRWHPDIPAVGRVKQGERFRVECVDWTGGQIKNDDSAEDVKTVDLTQVHYLSGPIEVENAEPGDLLKVEILDICPLEESKWGFSGIFDKHNGGGFLCESFPCAAKAIWDFEDCVHATSRHIPGVRFEGIIHPGLIGTAPSKKLLDEWNQREEKLNKNHPHALVAALPSAKGALVGKLEGTPEGEKIKSEAARTVPGRENGGNCDIKNLTRGSVVYFPVFIPGANLSMGDIHFSQGDGEISFCGGIEMAGALTLRCTVIKGGMSKYHLRNPIFETSPLEPKFDGYLAFEGFSVTENGEQKYLCATTAYRMACLNAIEYLSSFGWTKEQIYMLLSCAPIEGRISGIVDFPNALTTLYIPKSIFALDISPNNEETPKRTFGQVALCP